MPCVRLCALCQSVSFISVSCISYVWECAWMSHVSGVTTDIIESIGLWSRRANALNEQRIHESQTTETFNKSSLVNDDTSLQWIMDICIYNLNVQCNITWRHTIDRKIYDPTDNNCIYYKTLHNYQRVTMQIICIQHLERISSFLLYVSTNFLSLNNLIHVRYSFPYSNIMLCNIILLILHISAHISVAWSAC